MEKRIHNVPEIDLLLRTLGAYSGSVWWVDFKTLENPSSYFMKTFKPDYMTSIFYNRVHLN